MVYTGPLDFSATVICPPCPRMALIPAVPKARFITLCNTFPSTLEPAPNPDSDPARVQRWMADTSHSGRLNAGPVSPKCRTMCSKEEFSSTGSILDREIPAIWIPARSNCSMSDCCLKPLVGLHEQVSSLVAVTLSMWRLIAELPNQRLEIPFRFPAPAICSWTGAPLSRTKASDVISHESTTSQ